MFKLIFGLIIVGLILYIIYQVRKESDKYKNMQNARDRLGDLNAEIDVLGIEDQVLDARKSKQKAQAKLDEREEKLNKNKPTSE